MKMVRRHGRSAITLGVVGVTVYFFAKALSRNWEQVREISLVPNVQSVIGIMLFVLSVVISGLLWRKVLNALVPSKNVSRFDAVRIHIASWLLKYIPGQAGSYINKLAWATSRGYSKKALTNSFIYENALLLFASIVLSVPIVVFSLGEQASADLTLFVPLLVVLPLLVILHRGIFYGLVSAAYKKLRKQEISKELFLKSSEVAGLLFQYLAPRVAIGAGFVFIANSLVPVEASDYIPLAAIYILAGAVGLLAVFVPSGLGVREAVIVLLASAYMSPAQAVVVAVAARFYATIADLLLAGIYLVLNKGKVAQQ